MIPSTNPLLPPLLEDAAATSNLIKAKAYAHKLRAAGFDEVFRKKQVWKYFGIRILNSLA